MMAGRRIDTATDMRFAVAVEAASTRPAASPPHRVNALGRYREAPPRRGH